MINIENVISVVRSTLHEKNRQEERDLASKIAESLMPTKRAIAEPKSALSLFARTQVRKNKIANKGKKNLATKRDEFDMDDLI